jgi:hypothetical protein
MEIDHLAHDSRDALNLFLNPPYIVVVTVLFGDGIFDQVEGILNSTERVIDFVRDSGSHAPGGRELVGLHLLALQLPNPFLSLPLLGDIAGKNGEADQVSFVVENGAIGSMHEPAIAFIFRIDTLARRNGFVGPFPSGLGKFRWEKIKNVRANEFIRLSAKS